MPTTRGLEAKASILNASPSRRTRSQTSTEGNAGKPGLSKTRIATKQSAKNSSAVANSSQLPGKRRRTSSVVATDQKSMTQSEEVPRDDNLDTLIPATKAAKYDKCATTQHPESTEMASQSETGLTDKTTIKIPVSNEKNTDSAVQGPTRRTGRVRIQSKRLQDMEVEWKGIKRMSDGERKLKTGRAQQGKLPLSSQTGKPPGKAAVAVSTQKSGSRDQPDSRGIQKIQVKQEKQIEKPSTSKGVTGLQAAAPYSDKVTKALPQAQVTTSPVIDSETMRVAKEILAKQLSAHGQRLMDVKLSKEITGGSRSAMLVVSPKSNTNSTDAPVSQQGAAPAGVQVIAPPKGHKVTVFEIKMSAGSSKPTFSLVESGRAADVAQNLRGMGQHQIASYLSSGVKGDTSACLAQQDSITTVHQRTHEVLKESPSSSSSNGPYIMKHTVAPSLLSRRKLSTNLSTNQSADSLGSDKSSKQHDNISSIEVTKAQDLGTGSTSIEYQTDTQVQIVPSLGEIVTDGQEGSDDAVLVVTKPPQETGTHCMADKATIDRLQADLGSSGPVADRDSPQNEANIEISNTAKTSTNLGGLDQFIEISSIIPPSEAPAEQSEQGSLHMTLANTQAILLDDARPVSEAGKVSGPASPSIVTSNADNSTQVSSSAALLPGASIKQHDPSDKNNETRPITIMCNERNSETGPITILHNDKNNETGPITILHNDKNNETGPITILHNDKNNETGPITILHDDKNNETRPITILQDNKNNETGSITILHNEKNSETGSITILHNDKNNETGSVTILPQKVQVDNVAFDCQPATSTADSSTPVQCSDGQVKTVNVEVVQAEPPATAPSDNTTAGIKGQATPLTSLAEMGVSQLIAAAEEGLSQEMGSKQSNKETPKETTDDKKYYCVVYKCTECDYSTEKKGNWYKHKKKHAGTRPYYCDQCDYCATTSSNLKRHQLTHTNTRQYQCGLCSLMFRQKIHLERHIKYKHEEKKVKCSLCDYVCANENPDLKIHIRRKHTPTATRNGDGVPLTCNECGFIAPSKKDLKQHQKFHKKGPELKLYCEHCSFVTDCASRLQRHTVIHTKERPFACGLCDYRGSQKEHVIRHMKTKHNLNIARSSRARTKAYVEGPGTPSESAGEAGPSSLEQDGSIDAEGGPGTPMTGDIDNPSEDTPRRRKYEPADYSNKEKLFACNHCTMKFAKLINLYKHLHVQHKELQPPASDNMHQCVVCEFRTSKKKNLLVHMRKHNLRDGEFTPLHIYSCVICNYSSAKRRNLYHHMKKRHMMKILVRQDGTASYVVEDGNMTAVAMVAEQSQEDGAVVVQEIMKQGDPVAVAMDPTIPLQPEVLQKVRDSTAKQVTLQSLQSVPTVTSMSGVQTVMVETEPGQPLAAVQVSLPSRGSDPVDPEAASALQGLQALAEQSPETGSGSLVMQTVDITPVSSEDSSAQKTTQLDSTSQGQDDIQLSAEQLMHLSSGDYIEINGEVYKVEFSSAEDQPSA